MYNISPSPFRILVEFPQKIVTIDIAPLGHWLWDELHVSVLLEELEHCALPGPDVALDGHHEGSVVAAVLHALGRTDRSGGVTWQVKRHRHWFLCSVSKMRKFV